MRDDLYRSTIITGGGGMLAHALKCALRKRGIGAVTPDRHSLDITRPDDVRSELARYRPRLVLNCAAFTKVDLCEQQLRAALDVNARGPAWLAVRCAEIGAKLVHFSTDFVFDGKGSQPYRTEDVPNPLSAYGASKWLGEQMVQDVEGLDHLIVRTAWLYGPHGSCFPQTMINLAKQGKPLMVVDDQVGSPTLTHDLAEATLNLIDAGARGVFHVTNSGQTTWHDFTAAILDEFELKTDLTRTTSSEWKKLRPDSATRPAYSVLDTSAYTRLTGKPLRPWREALHAYHLSLLDDRA